ncbi:hypothetical protein E2C01_074688 [Portunus trituberculatus]|uniref:Uncharacterized protein n=1 Tax=Portunus trituberculatus TaxID=210409 RepID=A0A5B7I6A8_PORTR|nr:hypothetical protein [Portunus trituberculatus]
MPCQALQPFIPRHTQILHLILTGAVATEAGEDPYITGGNLLRPMATAMMAAPSFLPSLQCLASRMNN